MGPDEQRVGVHPVRAGGDGVDPSGPRGRGVAGLRAVDEVEQEPTPLTQQVRRPGQITTDYALVRAWRGDRRGNLVFLRAAANFNPLAAMASGITIAEVEKLVAPGELRPDEVHLPGIYVQRVVELSVDDAADKQIEKRTVRS